MHGPWFALFLTRAPQWSRPRLVPTADGVAPPDLAASTVVHADRRMMGRLLALDDWSRQIQRRVGFLPVIYVGAWGDSGTGAKPRGMKLISFWVLVLHRPLARPRSWNIMCFSFSFSPERNYCFSMWICRHDCPSSSCIMGSLVVFPPGPCQLPVSSIFSFILFPWALPEG